MGVEELSIYLLTILFMMSGFLLFIYGLFTGQIYQFVMGFIFLISGFILDNTGDPDKAEKWNLRMTVGEEKFLKYFVLKIFSSFSLLFSLNLRLLFSRCIFSGLLFLHFHWFPHDRTLYIYNIFWSTSASLSLLYQVFWFLQVCLFRCIYCIQYFS